MLDDRKIEPVPLRVADAMTWDPITLSPHHTFAEVVSFMAQHPFRHFLVVESPRRLVGVISDRDVLRALARTPNWHASYARELMSRDVIVVKPDTELSLAAGEMLSKRINCLPVVDDSGDICGIITSTDLLKSYRTVQESLEKQSALNMSRARDAKVER
jgi:CBS domain-containing protein